MRVLTFQVMLLICYDPRRGIAPPDTQTHSRLYHLPATRQICVSLPALCLMLIVRYNAVVVESGIITAQKTIRVSIAQARQWFLELDTHPERYRFETHAGFAFDQDDGCRFGEVGARFQTRERFYGLELVLRFELTEVGGNHFRFRLIRPALPVWGAFVLQEAGSDATSLCLAIGGTNRLGDWFLRLPLIRGAVRRQIHGEVEHIRASMEATWEYT
jgi:hypothetical protein